ncbi:MAG TPA: hypothetical protein VGQ57_15640 [Polyangiaceae bacterium]|jgi:hypothetical protein|nr:hypothetical protein [Polyangiaceae bacterium]
MFVKRRMFADQARALERCPHVFLAAALALSAFVGCGGQRIQNTATYAGNGVYKGEPPMCFQYRGEARPTGTANNIWVHINNTCRYDVDCNIWDSISDKEHRMLTPTMQTRSFLAQPETPERRFTLKLDCTWKS